METDHLTEEQTEQYTNLIAVIIKITQTPFFL